jgi:DNA primase
MYDYLLSLMSLSDKHREELKTKRGLTDDTIDKFKFVSGIKKEDADSIKEKMLEKYSEDELKSAHILLAEEDIKKGKAKEGDLTYTIVGNRVVVPFITDGKCTYLRMHKFGLPNMTPSIYDARNTQDGPLIITEGEFKASALNQLGYNAIASPGISTFGGKNFATLEEFVVNSSHEEVYIMFDGEIKSDPKLGSYKSDRLVRYDTDFWAWKICKMLSSSSSCNVVVWPTPWLINGKIDPDAALAAGRTRDDFDALISCSLSHKDYRESWTGEQKAVLDIKVKRDQFKSTVFERGGEYYKRMKVKGGEEDEWYDKRLSNFVLQIISKYQTFEENGDASIVREVKLMDSNGRPSRKAMMVASNFSSAGQFAEFAASKGDFQWLGTGDELRELVAKLYMEQDAKECEQPLTMGQIDDVRYPGMYMGNMCYLKDGTYVEADDDGGFWRNSLYVKPDSLVQGDCAGRTPIHINKDPHDWRKSLDDMCDHYGSEAPRVLTMWMLGSLMADHFFKAYGGQGSFPLMFVGGRFSSGKTTVVSQCMNFIGMGDNPSIEMDGTTIVGIGRMLTYHSCLPVWLDETRNTGKTQKAQSFFRNVWNRASAFKGLRNTTKVRAVDTKGTLVLSGQSLPTDAAFNERFVKVYINKDQRKGDQTSFKQISLAMSKVSSAAHELLTIPHIGERLVDMYHKSVDSIQEEVANDRVARNYGVVLTMAHLLDCSSTAFNNYLFECADDSHTESVELDESAEFLQEFAIWMMIDKVDPYEYFNYSDVLGHRCCFSKAYDQYATVKRRRGEDAFEKKALLAQLVDKGVFKGNRRESYKGARLMGFIMDAEKIPVDLKEYVEDYRDNHTSY